jgi:hypothetical protein
MCSNNRLALPSTSTRHVAKSSGRAQIQDATDRAPSSSLRNSVIRSRKGAHGPSVAYPSPGCAAFTAAQQKGSSNSHYALNFFRALSIALGGLIRLTCSSGRRQPGVVKTFPAVILWRPFRLQYHSHTTHKSASHPVALRLLLPTVPTFFQLLSAQHTALTLSPLGSPGSPLHASLGLTNALLLVSLVPSPAG